MVDIVTILPIIGLILLSGLFSGLTLGLLSLDVNQLEVVIEAGDEEQQLWASAILPIRESGNWLLCTLLLGNVAVNALLSILLADMTSGTMGFILSTVLIVLFGEIIPQATCARYGLAIGYYTLPITKAIMCLVAILAWPVSKVLDCALGKEAGMLWTRAEMMTLLMQQQKKSLTEDGQQIFAQDETGLMVRVLQFKEIKVETVMTPIKDTFMLESEAVLDFECLASIFQSGHSRIPIYQGTKDSIIGLLFTKDLIMLNPEDEFSVADLLKFYNHFPIMVHDDETCDKLLESFKSGKSHMAIVHQVVEYEDGRDSTYANVGLLTLEDVIEALIGSDIVDESDVYSNIKDGKLRKMSSNHNMEKGIMSQTSFIDMFRRKKTHNALSPQEVTTVYQVLQAEVPAFAPSMLSVADAKRLLSTCTIEQLNRGENDGRTETADGLLYEKGKKCDFFLLVLEGRLTVNAGSENFQLQLGPWKPLGATALLASDYLSDFNASVSSDTCRFLKIFQAEYDNAKAGGLRSSGGAVDAMAVRAASGASREDGSVPGERFSPALVATATPADEISIEMK